MGASSKKLSLPSESIDLTDLRDSVDRYYRSVTDIKREFAPVDVKLIVPHKIPDVALYLPDTPPATTFHVFRGKGLYLSDVELKNLETNGITQVYIARADIAPFTQYVEGLVNEIGATTTIVDEAKVKVLREEAISVMADIFESPTPEKIQKGVKVVSGFVYLLMKDPKAYSFLLNLSSHDPYTLQHSVGVATNSIILAKKIGIDDEASLIEIGIGGLLHDIGKTKVAKEIINKKGPLDEKEWAEMRQHSLFGYEIVKDNPNIGMRAKLAILQHHEEPGGTGYPMGLAKGQIDIFAQVVCLADIYNAITTDRSYSKAKAPFEAFALIKEKLAHKVDPKLFEALVLIYGGKGF